MLECVARFLEGAVLGGWKYQKEKAILSILRCSTLYPTFKDNAVLLFEQYLKILQNHHAEHRRAKAVLSTHESSTRRGYDERHNWTESPQGSSRGLQCISALSQVLQFLVKWECSVDQEEDPDCGVWAELVKNDQFVISLLKVYLMTSHNKEGKYTHVSMILSDLILEVGEARLICPLIEVLKWSRDEESFLPCFTRLVDDISSHSSGSKRSFITALINQGMLQVVLEGFKSSYRSDMSSEPAVLNLPYVWHLFKASSKEAVQNLAEQGACACLYLPPAPVFDLIVLLCSSTEIVHTGEVLAERWGLPFQTVEEICREARFGNSRSELQVSCSPSQCTDPQSEC